MFSCQPISAQNRECDALFSNTHFATTGTELINERGEVNVEFDQLGEDVNDDCIQTLELLDCFLSLPACNPVTGMVMPLCPESCPEVEQIIAENCGDAFFINNTMDFPFLNQLINFNCSNPESYFNFPSLYFSNSADDCGKLDYINLMNKSETILFPSLEVIGIINYALLDRTM